MVDAHAVVDHMTTAYAELDTYEHEATLVTAKEHADPALSYSRDSTSSIAYAAPDWFAYDERSGVVADHVVDHVVGNADEVWTNQILVADYTQHGTTGAILNLLSSRLFDYPGGRLGEFADASVAGVTDVEGVPCYELRLQRWNGDTESLWVGVDDSLVRRYRRTVVYDETARSWLADAQASPYGRRSLLKKTCRAELDYTLVTTETFRPMPNAPLSDDDFVPQPRTRIDEPTLTRH